MGPMEDHPKSVARSSLAFLSGTLLSRFTGMARDVSMAVCFGSHPVIAAFMVAFRLANLIRRLFGEGPLASGFIPHFEQVRSASAPAGARFFRDLLFSVTAVLVLLTLLAEGGLALWLRWADVDTAEILFFTMLMLPGMLFICLFGLSSALLQCEKKFFLTGVAPVAFNLVWIATVLWLKGSNPVLAAIGLCVAVVLAFLMQWLTLAPQTFAYLKCFLSWKEFFQVRLFSEEIRKVAAPLLLSVAGICAVQVNSALDSLFARASSLEGPAYLWYAIRLEQLPLALFGIALSSALLPPLARAVKGGDLTVYRSLLQFSLGRSFSLMLPCTVALLVLGVSGINLLYGHGDFDGSATRQTTLCLWGYAVGLVPAVFVLLLAPAFYARKEYRIPMRGAFLSVLCNVALTAVLVFLLKWGPFSIAVATSACAFFNSFYLSHALKKQVGPLFSSALRTSFSKTLVASCIAGGVTLLVGHFFIADPTLALACGSQEVFFPRQISVQLLHFLALSGTFVLSLFSYAWVVRADDLLQLIGIKPSSSSVRADLSEQEKS